jgi:hypothetical protein
LFLDGQNGVPKERPHIETCKPIPAVFATGFAASLEGDRHGRNDDAVPPSLGEPPPSPPPAIVYYGFLFSNIDGTVSTNPSPGDGAQHARFWYTKQGGANGPPAVIVWGFDAAQNVLAPITFAVSSVPNVTNPVGSGGEIPTSEIAEGNVSASVTAPDFDGVAQQPGVREVSFQY